MKISWKLALLLAVIAGVGTWLAADHRTWGRVENVLKQISGSARADESRPSRAWVSEPARRNSWDHLISLTPDQFEGIGVRTVAVKEQTFPTLLRLNGATDYDPAKLTVVRPPVSLIPNFMR